MKGERDDSEDVPTLVTNGKALATSVNRTQNLTRHFIQFMCAVNACSRLTAFISFGTAGGAMPTVPRLMVASFSFLPLCEGVWVSALARSTPRRWEHESVPLQLQMGIGTYH